MHSKRVCKKYHGLHLKNHMLLLGNAFENLRKMYLKIYHLDPTKYPVTQLEWQNSFKKTEVKLEFSTANDMLLMVKKGIRGGICHTIHQYAKANNKCVKDCDINKE